jgi:DNA-binding beta-propeller fold protein YncE
MSLFSNVLSQARLRLVQAGSVLAVAAFFAGCGNSYRPVITPINPTGPASQPISFAVVVSSPGANVPGIATVLDYSGDSILTQAPIGPNPFAFTLDSNGANGYTANSDHTLTNFQVSNTQPQEKNISFSTLPVTAQTVGLFSPTAGLWSPDLNGNVVDVLAINGAAEAFKLAVPVATTPIAVVGLGTLGQHIYSISQNVPFDVTCNNAPTSVAQNGEADALEVSSFTVSQRIPLGKCPVYGVSSSDGRRLFVLNRGSDTVTVINSLNNTLDQCTPFTNQNGQLVTCHPSLPLSTSAGLTGANVTSVAGPVYAEYIPATQQLVVANYDGGTITLIDVSLDEFGNDSQTFGTTFTIPVGHNPASVTVLADGSRAYTADQADGTVHIVNLTSHTVEKTLTVTGHPRTVVSTSNSLFGKVYVASPDTTFLTIIRTDQDIVDTTVLIEGNIVDVRVSSQTTSKGNNNISSRIPGGGQPCYQPGPTASLAVCQNIHP